MRWISSTKTTSPSLTPLRMAARSPAWVIAGPLVSRSGGGHLRGDDHGQGGLAEPGRPREQHVVGGPATLPGGLEHQAELVAHPGLPDHLVERPRAQGGLDGPLVALGLSRGQGLAGTAPRRRPAAPRDPAQALLRVWRAARIRRPTSGWAPASSETALDRLVGLLGRPPQAEQALVDLVAPGLGPAHRSGAGTDPRRRPDPVTELEDDPLGALLPDARDPGQRLDVVGGDGAAQVVGAEHRQHRLGELGPHPRRRLDQLEDRASHRRRGSRTGSASPPAPPCWSAAWTRDRDAAWPACPGCTSAPGRRRRPRRRPRSRATAATRPRTKAIIEGSWTGCGRRGRAAACLAAASSRRDCAPPRQMWLMASARASAASAGLGGADSRSRRVTIAADLCLVGAAAARDRGLDLARACAARPAAHDGRPPPWRSRWPGRCP